MNVSSFIKSVFLYNMETRLHLILISPWFRSCGLGWISWALECRSIRRVHGLGGCSSTSTFCILDIFKKIALNNVIRRLSFPVSILYSLILKKIHPIMSVIHSVIFFFYKSKCTNDFQRFCCNILPLMA